MKGDVNLSDMFMVIVLVVFVIAVIVAGATSILSVQQNTQVQGATVYGLMAKTEKLLNAPCATETRGVFLEEDVKAGKLDCAGVSNVMVSFNISNSCRSTNVDCVHQELTGDSTDPTVSAVTTEEVDAMQEATSTTLPVTMYDRETGERNYATMEVILLQ